MSNLKNPNQDEKILGIVARAIGGIICLIIFLMGVVIKPAGAGTGQGFLWDQLHPASFLHLVGLILVLVFGLAVSGVLFRAAQLINYLFRTSLPEEIMQPAGSAVAIIALIIIGAAGVALLYA